LLSHAHMLCCYVPDACGIKTAQHSHGYTDLGASGASAQPELEQKRARQSGYKVGFTEKRGLDATLATIVHLA
ncbi:hypothetical protein DIPPA_26673, partial [Diplonema papillatum]